jgi:hypothetical protein
MSKRPATGGRGLFYSVSKAGELARRLVSGLIDKFVGQGQEPPAVLQQQEEPSIKKD